jgi:CRISPR-associated protein Cas6
MATIELVFALTSAAPIAADHGYHLYAAISRVLPVLHEPNGIAIHPIRGQQAADRQMQLDDFSHLTIRTSADCIGGLLPLAGKQLTLAGRILRVGVPQVRALIPSPTLRSRLVTIRNGTEPGRFLNELRRKLDAFGVSSDAIITLPQRNDKPIRRTIRIKDKEVVGYEVIISGLSPDESLKVQSNQPTDLAFRFSRSHMGCGIFTPIAEGKA